MNKRSSAIICTLVGVLAAATACEKASKEPTVKAAMPDAVLFQLTVASPKAASDGLRAYVQNVSPQVAMFIGEEQLAALLGKTVGGVGLSGFDTQAPFKYAWLENDAGKGGVLFGKVGKQDQLLKTKGEATLIVRDGYAVVGDAFAVELAKDWCFSTWKDEATPEDLIATAYPERLLHRYGKKMDEGIAVFEQMAVNQGGALTPELLQGYAKLARTLGQESNAVRIGLNAKANQAGMWFAVSPKPNTELAKFVALQKPASFALVEKVSALDAYFLYDWQIDLGVYKDAMMKLSEGFNIQYQGIAAQIFSEMFLTSQELLLAGKTGIGEGSQLVLVAPRGNNSQSDVDLNRFWKGLEQNPRGKVTAGPQKSKINDVEVTSATLEMLATPEPANLPPGLVGMLKQGPQVIETAQTDELVFLTARGEKQSSVIGLLMEQMRNPKSPGLVGQSPWMKASVERSKQRKDSAWGAFDFAIFMHAMLAALAPEQQLPSSAAPFEHGMTFSVGFASGDIEMGIEIDAASLKGAIDLTQKMNGAGMAR